MRVYKGSKNLKIEGSAVALGDFDAIHKGHIEIIKSAGEYAKENGLLWTVYMFSKRPNKMGKSINTLEKRLGILENLGVDVVITEEFTEGFKNTSCEEFVSEYIIKRLNAKAVFVGYNYRFGKGAKGDAKVLKELLLTYNTEVFVSDCVKNENVALSSSEIRKLIENGEMEKVKLFMGRNFSVSGRVVEGKKLGRTIGFPTANIEYPKDTVIPQSGVYISRTTVGDNKYYSITNVGEKPTVSDETKNIETAIGGFSRDIYGETIGIEFVKKIRDIEKFDSLSELKKQLETDMNEAKEYFEKRNKNE